MYCILAVWLIISPNASVTKSRNMNDDRCVSHRRPGAQTREPALATIGVSRNRSGPYFSYNPKVVPKVAAALSMPSPTTEKSSSSRSISSAYVGSSR